MANLFVADSVFNGDEDHDDVAQSWTVKYEGDNTEAMKDMVNLILKASLHPTDTSNQLLTTHCAVLRLRKNRHKLRH